MCCFFVKYFSTPKTDGGYIVDKRIFNKTDTLITCGLNDDWEFEKNFHHVWVISYEFYPFW